MSEEKLKILKETPGISTFLTRRQADLEIQTNDSLDRAISQSQILLLSQQFEEGYWWYTLEADESINAEYILLNHYLNTVDPVIESKIVSRLIHSQSLDGSWSLYYGDSGNINTTIECYFALKMAGISYLEPFMIKAKEFILSKGGLSQSRVFTRILLAQFGLIPWSACPKMPVQLILSPSWSPINIYDFSSWARVSIVPLLVILDQKKSRKIATNFLQELYTEAKPEEIEWSFNTEKSSFSFENFFIQFNKVLKVAEYSPVKPFRDKALIKCEEWIREHVGKTEDIYPALAFGAMALYDLGYPVEDATIQKCLKALKKFQTTIFEKQEISSLPSHKNFENHEQAYQQCCISPVWDTPWSGVALIESGISPGNEKLQKTGDWLLSKQILHTYGDWNKKNKKSLPGGWSFEFENEYFPDVDDTIQVLMFFNQMGVTGKKYKEAQQRGLDWVLSMQSKNGGWAAFDVNNDKAILNKIPFSDHGACLDPPTPDITGRTLEFLSMVHYNRQSSVVKRAIRFLEKTQEKNGSWEGRWGVNYLYGTWSAVQGLKAIGYSMNSPRIKKATEWLKFVQRNDGGYGESCESYNKKDFVPLGVSVPSQTAWALMGLIAVGEGRGVEAARAADYLVRKQNAEGSWNERQFTGTGFPGHFYIRYHGYRHYFPMIALAKYRNI